MSDRLVARLVRMSFMPAWTRSLPVILVLAAGPLVFLLYWMWRMRLTRNLRGMVTARLIEAQSFGTAIRRKPHATTIDRSLLMIVPLAGRACQRLGGFQRTREMVAFRTPFCRGEFMRDDQTGLSWLPAQALQYLTVRK